MKHTQGELRAEGSQRSNATWLENNLGQRICTMYPRETDWGDAQELARRWNCHAGLLEALKDCAGVCAGETLNKQSLVLALEKARAAITRAEATL